MVLSGKDFQEPAAEEVVEEAEAVVLVEMDQMQVVFVDLAVELAFLVAILYLME